MMWALLGLTELRGYSRALHRANELHWTPDRKSTRLNSSHMSISYAVFCLKKKKPQLGTDTNHATFVSERRKTPNNVRLAIAIYETRVAQAGTGFGPYPPHAHCPADRGLRT